MSRKYFGTDGVRGRVGVAPITADFALHLGWAAGKALAAKGSKKVLIGKDTRISGYMFESALEAGLSAAGVDAILLGPMPTPAIAYLTATFRAAAGIVISASHNPYHDNGIKFFNNEGTKLDDDVELEIEKWLDRPMETVESDQLGKARRLNDARGRYIEFCKSRVPNSFSLKGLKMVVDCANGATYHIAPAVFDELGAEVIAIGVNPNGVNINDNCGSTSPQALQQAVLEHKADLGVALDGDGDRLLMVDNEGTILDGDQLLYILAAHRHQQGRMEGGVVGTLMSNLGLELALGELNIPFQRANVGDRYVMALLKQHNWTLGGESSGHIICRDAIETGDGIIAALQVLVALTESGKSLKQASAAMPKIPQILVNVPVAERFDPLSKKQVNIVLQEVELDLGNRGRVLLRASGTEPLIRVMVEGEDGAIIKAHAERLAEVIKEAGLSI